MRTAAWMVPACVLAVLVGCSGGDQGDKLAGEVRIAGSSTVYPISMAMAEEFKKIHPNVRVTVSSTGTGGGFRNFFIPGKTDINDASRPIEASEVEQCRRNGIEPIELRVGIDALSMVVNKANKIDSMTFAQLKRIWGPDNPPKRWDEVDPNWPKQPFELYGPASTSGTFDYLTEVVIGKEKAHRPDYQKTEQDNTIVTGIERNPYAIGYFGFAYYEQNKDKLKALKIAKKDGDTPVMPSLENARTGKYPLSRPLFIYVRKDALSKPHVRAFVEFYVHKAATKLVSDVGYVPVPEDVMKANLAKIEAK